METKRTKTKKQEYFLGLLFEEEILKDSDEKFESKIVVNSKEYTCKINYDNDRNCYHAIVIFNDKTTSLSFFKLKRIAYRNIKLFISGQNGKIGEVASEIKGD